jgi:hypothetical protein
MTTISFMTANYVARQLGYHMTGGWDQGDKATNAYFRPLESFPERFEALLEEISELGFTAIDLWQAHLNPALLRVPTCRVAQPVTGSPSRSSPT